MSITGNGAQQNRLYFNGDDENYELFEVKFHGLMRIKNLYDVIELPSGVTTPDATKKRKSVRRVIACS